MKITTKLITLTIAVAMLLTFTACGGQDDKTKGDTGSANNSGGDVNIIDESSAPASDADAPADDVNANISYEYLFSPLDGENDRYVTVIATNNNSIEIEGDFYVYFDTAESPIDFDDKSPYSSMEASMAPGTKHSFTTGLSKYDLPELEFTDVKAKGNFVAREAEEIAEHPLAPIAEIVLDYKIENGVITGTITNPNKDYSISSYRLGLVLYKGDEYVGGAFIWDHVYGSESMSVDAGETEKMLIDLAYVGEFDRAEPYIVGRCSKKRDE